MYQHQSDADLLLGEDAKKNGGTSKAKLEEKSWWQTWLDAVL